MNVLLVHGIFNDGSDFNPMVRALREAGHVCFVPALKPWDARYGIVDLAQKLETYVNETLPEGEAFALVAFSMGCLVSRWYVQEIVRFQRVAAFFAIAGPHSGTYLGYGYFGDGARDMRPGSMFLQRLAKSQGGFSAIPTYAYRGRFDHMILPNRSCEWAMAQNLVVSSCYHPRVPANKQVIDGVLNALAALEPVLAGDDELCLNASD